MHSISSSGNSTFFFSLIPLSAIRSHYTFNWNRLYIIVGYMQDDSGDMTEINEDSDEVGKIKCHVYMLCNVSKRSQKNQATRGKLTIQ